MKFTCSITVLIAALFLTTPLYSQSSDSQYRYTNPGQTQVVNTPSSSSSTPTNSESAGVSQSSANPFQQAIDRRNSQSGEGGEASGENESAFTNNEVGFGRQNAGPLWVQAEDIYRGVIPTIQDSLPHIERYQERVRAGSATNAVTWIGFQPFDQSTRIFVQTGGSAQYTVQTSPDNMTITVQIQDTRLSLSNFGREIDTSWFERPVTSIQAQRAGSGVDIVVALREAAEYTVTQSGEYLFIDFEE